VGEVKARMLRVAFLECFDDTEALLVVVEPIVILHQEIECLLSGVSKGRVTQVVGEGDRLGEILVQTECSSHCTTHRGDLDGVGQSGPVVVSLAVKKYLGFSIKSPEGGSVDDAIPVSLVAGPEGMLCLGKQSSCALGSPLGVGCKKRFAGVRGHGESEKLEGSKVKMMTEWKALIAAVPDLLTIQRF
jgi:hypothetical protein